MIALILIITSVILTTLYYVKNQWKYWAVARQLPGPKSYPIIGNAYQFIGVKNSEFVNIMRELHENFPSTVKFWLGPKLFIVTDDPKDIQILLNSPNAHSKGETYRLINLLMETEADSIISSTGERWRHHRKLLNPCFSANILESYVAVFNRSSRILADKVNKEVNSGQAFNVEHLIRACTIDMIADTSLGVELECQKHGDVPFTKACDRFMEVLTYRMFNVLLHPEFIFKWTKFYPIGIKAGNFMKNFCAQVLHNVINDSKRDTSATDSKTFINQLLKIAHSTDALNFEDIVSETVSTMLAGHDTSASAMSNTILLLAMHPEIQDKVVAELKKVLADQTSEITTEQLNQLTYLKQVIKESLRFFVITPMFSRSLTGDVTLSNGLTLPTGCQIAISVIALHRRKDVWGANADKFDPDHFAPNLERHPYAYLPFSGGPRICIGYKYANMAMAIVLAQLLRNYRFTTDLREEDLKWDFLITLRLANKHMVKVERREW